MVIVNIDPRALTKEAQSSRGGGAGSIPRSLAQGARVW